MTSLLQIDPTDTVLEIGTGCGYQTAILAELAFAVFAIEYHEKLAQQARHRLEEMGYTNIHVRVGDGHDGWIDHAPYQGILVTAATAAIPKELTQQLAGGGRLVAPIGNPYTEQILERWIRCDGGFDKSQHGVVKFVPLL